MSLPEKTKNLLNVEYIPEASVRVISYLGSASDEIGNNGDFYVDELTNILYGPKTSGVWPEEGMTVDGPVVCKRTFIQLNAARLRKKSAQLPQTRRLYRILSSIHAFFHLRLFNRQPRELGLQHHLR